MKKHFKLKQGNSYTFVGELKDNDGNVVQLSDYEKITVLITSPGVFQVTIRENEYRIENNKIIFGLSGEQTRFFRQFVKVEAALQRNGKTTVGVYEQNIVVEHNNISKL